jgi:hypothetical protein
MRLSGYRSNNSTHSFEHLISLEPNPQALQSTPPSLIMKPRTSSSGSARRVPDLKLPTFHPRAMACLPLGEAAAPNKLAEKIIEASQDLHSLGQSVLGGCSDDAALLAEVRRQSAEETFRNEFLFLMRRVFAVLA